MTIELPDLAKKLINHCQRQFPLTSQPFLALAEEFDASEQDIIDCLQLLERQQILSRIGPVFDHKQAGASTLAALAVPAESLDEIAEMVNQFAEVNHNYAREHDYNLWFVVTTESTQALTDCLQAIAEQTGYDPLVLPMEAAYHIDLSFPVNFNPSVKQVVSA